MATATGTQLAENIRQTVDELKKACAGIDEATASRAPEGRWSPKEILSHLIGPEGTGHMPLLKAFLERDTPTLELQAEKTFYSGERARMTFAQLIEGVDKEYDGIVTFTLGLTDEELGRKARIPMLKDSQLGEYPALAQMIGGLGGYHVKSHIDHMKEIVQALKG